MASPVEWAAICSISTAMLWLSSGWNGKANGISRTRTLVNIYRDGSSTEWRIQRGTRCSRCRRSRTWSFPFDSVPPSKRFDSRVCALLCSTCNTSNDFFASALVRRRRSEELFSQVALLLVDGRGCDMGLWRYAFDAFQKTN
jgi:hypothetical protein